MTDDMGHRRANDDPRATPDVRDAHDATEHRSLVGDPTDEDAVTDIANDESFPASDPPSHASIHHGEPAPSSGYDERAEQAIAARRQDAAAGEAEIHVSATEAQAGKKLGVMRYVLGISLVAIIVIFGVLLIVNR